MRKNKSSEKRALRRSVPRMFCSVSVLGGILLVFAILGLIMTQPVLAEWATVKDGWAEPLKDYSEGLGGASISISIGGANSEILNADKGVAQGMIKQTASVELGATNGYTVKVSGAPNLTGVNTKATIPSAALTLGNMVNQWGWYAVNGAADCSASSVYKTMSTDGTQIDSGVLADGGTKTYTMCFGMRVNGEQAADTYSGSVTVSVVAEPGMIKTAPFSGITYMQDMTANICKLADENETAQLIDRRDNKKYWVTKLLDGNCWMSQNLDFDISTTNVTMATSDVTSNWTSSSLYSPQITSVDLKTGAFSDSADNHANDTFSWDLGEYVISDPTDATLCGGGEYQTGGLAKCDRFVEIGSREVSADPNFYQKNGATYNATEYDAHYLVGNYYQWNAAMAGTGGTITSANASGSICPKNWKLPNAGSAFNDVSGSFYYLLSQYGVSSSITGNRTEHLDSVAITYTYDIARSPLFFVRGGGVYSHYASTPFQSAGQYGYYWSSRAYASDAGYAYSLLFDGGFVSPSYNSNRHYGKSLRCLIPTA